MKRFCLMCLMAGSMAYAQAEEVCKVTDPTGTPLNVRAAPNGMVQGKLRNFTRVTIVDYDSDDKGNEWAYVRWQGQPLRRDRRVSPNKGHEGWVFREFISCYER
ncbi:SH3 domain-containing protein [Neisseria shayeganii]|nr:SH3 domain-containing protein [Neisseria shayeganii]